MSFTPTCEGEDMERMSVLRALVPILIDPSLIAPVDFCHGAIPAEGFQSKHMKLRTYTREDGLAKTKKTKRERARKKAAKQHKKAMRRQGK